MITRVGRWMSESIHLLCVRIMTNTQYHGDDSGRGSTGSGEFVENIVIDQ